LAQQLGGRRGFQQRRLQEPLYSLANDAAAELGRTQTMSRDEWQIRIQTQMRLSSSRDAFLLQGGLRGCERANELCSRDWTALFIEISYEGACVA